jgi:radical SAM protein with 4Fe4S-binding SPASM domain
MTKFFGTFERLILKWISLNRDLPLQIDITNLCNLRCKHCYHPHHNNNGSLSLDDWFEVIKQYESLIKKFNYSRHILICGGEPFLSPQLLPILEYLLRLSNDYRLTILTNGTLVEKVNQQIFDTLRKFKSITFQISIDGPSAQENDLIRGPNSFSASINGAMKLQNQGFQVYFQSVLSQRSKTWIEGLFKLAEEKQVVGLSFTRFISEGHGRISMVNNEDKPLEPLELKQAFLDILKNSAKYKIKTNTNMPLFHLIHRGLGRSGRFFEGLVVNYKGNILASSRSRIVIGHVFNGGLEKNYLNNTVLKLIRKGNLAKCGQCRFLKICGGDRNAAFAASGNYFGRDPGCWLNDNYEDSSTAFNYNFIKERINILT